MGPYRYRESSPVQQLLEDQRLIDLPNTVCVTASWHTSRCGQFRRIVVPKRRSDESGGESKGSGQPLNYTGSGPSVTLHTHARTHIYISVYLNMRLLAPFHRPQTKGRLPDSRLHVILLLAHPCYHADPDPQPARA